MTEKTAWFCPACQAHHAPHVETCPKPKSLETVYIQPGTMWAPIVYEDNQTVCIKYRPDLS